MTKKNRRNRGLKIAMRNETDSVTPGANLNFVEFLTSLVTLQEALRSGDGNLCKIRKFTVHLRLYSTETFIIQPFIIQSAGSLTDTANLNDGSVDTVVDSGVDDDFGLTYVGQPKVATFIPMDNGNAAPTYSVGVSLQFDIPQNVLDILNAVSQSERLANLAVGFTGKACSNVAIYIRAYYAISYVEEVKSLVLR